MSAPPDGFGSAPTPPAYVRQLEERAGELAGKHSNLKSLVAANHIAVLHQLGDLATQMMSNNATTAELVEEVGQLRATVGTLATLIKSLSLHLGVVP